MPPGRARIVGVELPIGQPVERHRDAAGGDHAQQDADELLPTTATNRRRSRHAITAANSANGSANSVWLKRMSSRKWRMVLSIDLNVAGTRRVRVARTRDDLQLLSGNCALADSRASTCLPSVS